MSMSSDFTYLRKNSLSLAVLKAMRNVERFIAEANSDPTRPVFHFRSPALWMNDPNGAIYHKGYYHVFYQFNPYGNFCYDFSKDSWGPIFWGHARSHDLIHWENLPIALCPSKEKGEEHCFSGGAVINKLRQPMLFYASVEADIFQPRPIWTAVGDDDLIVWHKHKSNPVIVCDTIDGPNFKQMDSPYIFSHANRVFMITCATMIDTKGGVNPVIPIYEALDDEFVHWKYSGIMFSLDENSKRDLFRCSDADRAFECPNFVNFEDRYVLIFHPHKQLVYYSGYYDADSLKFVPDVHDVVDHGWEFGPCSILTDEKQRHIMFSWIRGFKSGQGWTGCLSLPRLLSLDDHGKLRQKPSPELQVLRGQHIHYGPLVLQNERIFLEKAAGDCLEILAEIKPGSAKIFGMKVRASSDGDRGVDIKISDGELTVTGTNNTFKESEAKPPKAVEHTLPIRLTNNMETLVLHIFLDKSVLELFVGDMATVTKVIYPVENDICLALYADDGTTLIESIDVWQMKPIWN